MDSGTAVYVWSFAHTSSENATLLAGGFAVDIVWKNGTVSAVAVILAKPFSPLLSIRTGIRRSPRDYISVVRS